MNAKMLELYRQAQVPHTAIDPSNNMPYETTCFSADKFAELIVRECCDAADMAYDARCRSPGDYVGEQLGYGEEHGVSNWRCGIGE
jgi:hypothetical protein